MYNISKEAKCHVDLGIREHGFKSQALTIKCHWTSALMFKEGANGDIWWDSVWIKWDNSREIDF